MKINNSKKGFTLAEVLITLLIIGVVAALVIPNIINDTQNAEYKTAYKKAFAIASQVTNQARTESMFMERSAASDPVVTLYNFNIFKSYFSVTKECINNNNNQCWNENGENFCTDTCSPSHPQGGPRMSVKAFVDASGMAWTMYSDSEDMIVVDTNGDNAPNKFGKDRWMFVFKDHQNHRITVGAPYKIGPYYNIDAISSDTFACHYPPCYFQKWLKE
jgi:prepilin-type N-terminal cleavage/methylation domain-containing protein